MTPEYYNNLKGSVYKFSNDQQLNAWEFDIVKRVVRCRRKGEWRKDLEKTIDLIKLYLDEYDDEKPAGTDAQVKLFCLSKEQPCGFKNVCPSCSVDECCGRCEGVDQCILTAPDEPLSEHLDIQLKFPKL